MNLIYGYNDMEFVYLGMEVVSMFIFSLDVYVLVCFFNLIYFVLWYMLVSEFKF